MEWLKGRAGEVHGFGTCGASISNHPFETADTVESGIAIRDEVESVILIDAKRNVVGSRGKIACGVVPFPRPRARLQLLYLAGVEHRGALTSYISTTESAFYSAGRLKKTIRTLVRAPGVETAIQRENPDCRILDTRMRKSEADYCDAREMTLNYMIIIDNK